MNIHNIFENIVISNSNIALVFNEQKLTYSELNIKSNQLAKRLNCYNEELIGILLEPCIETIISILAVLKSGGAYIPILPSFPKDRINYMTKDTNLKKMIINSEYNNLDLEIIDLRTFNYDEFDDSNLNLNIKETNLAYIIYTSGSTGKPKGVMIEHKNVINVCQDLQSVYKIDGKHTCKSILFSSFTWDVSVCEIFSNLFNGNTIYIFDEIIKKDIIKLYNYINENNIEICYFPPALLSLIPYEETCCIKKIIFAGEKCDNKVGLLWAKRVILYNYYGPVEGTIYVTGKQVNTNNVNEIGKPIQNINIYIVDEQNNLVKDGEKGELLFSGLGVARGYLNLSEETKKSFISNPYGKGVVYKTGDIVCMNKNGDLEYIGRVDNQVNIRGKRIELNEINENILLLKYIDNSVVKCKTNEYNINEYIYCNYTVKEDKSIIKDYPLIKDLENYYNNKIIDCLKEKLPNYMIPQYFILLDQFVLNTSGKIDQDKLKEPILDIKDNYKGELINNEEYILINKIINKINNTNLKYEPREDFKIIGIDSLKMIQLMSELSKNKIYIKIEDFIKCECINELINILNIKEEREDNTEKLYNYYRRKNGILIQNLHNLNMNRDADEYNTIKYFSNNFYIDNETNENLNCINNTQLFKNNMIYNIGYSGACQVCTQMDIYETFFKNKFINIFNIMKNVIHGQNNIFNIQVEINKEQLKSIITDSNNIVNEYTFPGINILEKYDIVIFNLDVLVAYHKIKHLKTGIEFISRKGSNLDHNDNIINLLDASKFVIGPSLSAKELKNCIDKIILKFPIKKFIFIKCNNNYGHFEWALLTDNNIIKQELPKKQELINQKLYEQVNFNNNKIVIVDNTIFTEEIYRLNNYYYLLNENKENDFLKKLNYEEITENTCIIKQSDILDFTWIKENNNIIEQKLPKKQKLINQKLYEPVNFNNNKIIVVDDTIFIEEIFKSNNYFYLLDGNKEKEFFKKINNELITENTYIIKRSDILNKSTNYSRYFKLCNLRYFLNKNSSCSCYIRKEYNKILDKYSNHKNIAILDINKYTNFNVDTGNSWHNIPIINVIYIVYELNKLINKVFKYDNNIINISKFFLDSDIYHYDNCKLSYLNENNYYLTNVISVNNKLNNKIKSIGLFFKFNNRFLRKYTNHIATSHILSTTNKDLYATIPISSYKLIFYGRTDKYYHQLRFRIYTGIKWIIIDKEITTEYQQFEINTTFNFTTSSKFRIGFENVEPNMIIYIYNPYLDL